MTRLVDLFAAPGRFTIGGAPSGRDALALAELIAAPPPAGLIYVARDDARMAQTAEALALFAPGVEIIAIPAWDCLPYDRVSPNAAIVARRLDGLTRLAGGPAPGESRPILLTTCNAIIQRLPPRQKLGPARLLLRAGDSIDVDRVVEFFARNGYSPTGSVMEPGEYALRGGILDIYPPGSDEPVRMDLFGDVIESLRGFDPLTQRSQDRRAEVVLVPASEVLLDAESIANFRGFYRELFGAVTGHDPLYEAVSAGMRHPGIEHWLPLFYPKMESLFDYMPDAWVVLDHLVDEARAERLATIADYHAARRQALTQPSPMSGPPYKPVPPERMFLTAVDWQARVIERAVGGFSPFAHPRGAGPGIDLGGRLARDFAPERKRRDANAFDAFRDHALTQMGEGKRVAVACYSVGTRDRIGALLREHGLRDAKPVDRWSEIESLAPGSVGLVVLGLDHGFQTDAVEVIGEQDLLGDRLVRPAQKKRRAADFLVEISSLGEGDLVVHVDHGIGRYQGLQTIAVDHAPHDCLLMLYAGGDRLFVPVENIELMSRYGSDQGTVELDRLGSAAWQSRKARLRQRLRDMAAALIRTAAERLTHPAPTLHSAEGAYDEFAARFPYAETEDQQQAIQDTLADLASGQPTDRLICGDVGFGKTEVALRAAFVAASAGKQVAVVVPTTLLCRQHFRTFSERFAGLPIRIEQLSRLTLGKNAAAARAGLTDGSVDIVIGTHALLSASVKFARLGLLIIDEEQHFGVAQKERLKALRADVHVLTMTATPIPRTLQMALAGVRELSVIATPPVDRLAVRTFVMPYDSVVIREAIMREHYRGGQLFYICPRIEDLDGVVAEVRRIAPEVKIALAHGRMPARALEQAMSAFYDRAVDVLVSTSIIESGLDVPSANTLIVHRADLFGLSQLYQLRGRVGRAKQRAYAYFTVPTGRLLRGAAEKRLEVIQALDHLGAGFALASHDLDIRGAGNLLGEEQSGHIREVGIELYQHLLEEAVQAARAAHGGMTVADSGDSGWSPHIAVGTAVLIPERYVLDLGVRLGLYRRLSELSGQDALDAFAVELVDRFGPLPVEVDHLLKVVAIKQLSRRAGIDKVDAGPKGAVLGFRQNRFAAPEKLVGFIARADGGIRLRPDHRLVVAAEWADENARLAGVHDLVRSLVEIAESAGR